MRSPIISNIALLGLQGSVVSAIYIPDSITVLTSTATPVSAFAPPLFEAKFIPPTPTRQPALEWSSTLSVRPTITTSHRLEDRTPLDAGHIYPIPSRRVTTLVNVETMVKVEKVLTTVRRIITRW